MPRYWTLAFLLLSATQLQAAEAPRTQTIQIIDRYAGGFRDVYPQELNLVRSFVSSVQSDIAVQLGLQFGQGFEHPVSIRFDDGAPSASENPFFYVETKGSGPEFSQEIVANVEAFARRRADAGVPVDPRGGFRYAMAQAMLNDLSAGDARKALPFWVQEGLSVFASGSGDGIVKATAERVPYSKAMELVRVLNNRGPYLTPRESASDYLGIKYIASTGALPTFVRSMTHGKSAADAIRETLGYEWSTFEANVRNFSYQEFARHTPPDDDPVFRGPASGGKR